MKSVCLFFQVHQPFRYRRYRFFDIGNDHYYYDDYANETILERVVENCYLPANKILLELLEKFEGKFKVAFSISGTALDQFELYAPEVIGSFKTLANTGCVEFLAMPYAHSLASLADKTIFEKQVIRHSKRISELFGHKPKSFFNTEMIYSDEIGAQVADMGFEAMLTEGAKHVLGWKSPNFLYVNAINPRLKVLMRNFKLSDDLAFRFSNTAWNEYPLTAGKFANWLAKTEKNDEIINLFLNYEAFGEIQKKESGIFEFLRVLPEAVLASCKLNFATPSEIAGNKQPISAVHVPQPVSWAGEERDMSIWLGNEMQEEALSKLYALEKRMKKCSDPELNKDWEYLQVSDHFYYMSSIFFKNDGACRFFNPYSSPYEAFINYMNVLSDFKIRLNSFVPEKKVQQKIASLNHIIVEKEALIKKYEAEISRLQKQKKTGKQPNSKP
jgi:alpha-amylase